MQELDTDVKVDESELENTTSTSDGNPKFGRLLLVLALGVAIMVVLTFASQAYYTS